MDRDNTLFQALKGSLFSLLTFIALSLILILLSALVLLFLKDPAHLIPTFGIGTLLISSLVGGAICTYLSKKPFFSSIPALTAILIILTGSVLFKESSLSFGVTIGSYISVFIAFLAGGFIMHLLSNRRPKRRKRR